MESSMRKRFPNTQAMSNYSPSITSIWSIEAYHIETDTSNFAIGATLLQENDEGRILKPVAYFSRKLKDAQRNYAANERVLLAIVEALKEWRCYVEGLPITIRTDHKPLIYAQGKMDVPPRLLKWIEELQHYQPIIEYQRGKENLLADTLSRCEDWKEDHLNSILEAEYSDWSSYVP